MAKQIKDRYAQSPQVPVPCCLTFRTTEWDLPQLVSESPNPRRSPLARTSNSPRPVDAAKSSHSSQLTISFPPWVSFAGLATHCRPHCHRCPFLCAHRFKVPSLVVHSYLLSDSPLLAPSSFLVLRLLFHVLIVYPFLFHSLSYISTDVECGVCFLRDT